MRWLVVAALLLLPAAQAASVGDEVEYLGNDGAVTYRWGDAVRMPDRDGGTSLAWTLHIGDETWWLSPDGDMLARGTAKKGEPDPEDRPAWNLVYGDQPPGNFVRRQVDYREAAAPCAMVVTRSHERLDDPCTVDGAVLPAGTPVAAPQAPWHDVLEVVWDDEAYPARLAFGQAEETRRTLAKGSVALPEATRRVAHIHGDDSWHVATPEPWGPSEAGVVHPWSRQAAFEAALADPRMLELKRWLDGRDAWPQAGSAMVIDDGVARMKTWTFTLSDGQETLSFAVRRHAGSVMEMYMLESPAPVPRAAVPDAWPTLATLQQRLDRHVDPSWGDVEATWWGYRVDPDHGLVFEVAHDVSEVRDGTQWFHRESLLAVTADGRTLSYSDMSAGGPEAFPFLPVNGQPAPADALVQRAGDPDWHSLALGLGIGGLAIALRWIVWPLFTRIRRADLLDHPRRRQIHDAIQEAPGIHLSELRRTLGMANGTLIHHLRALETGGLVQADRHTGYTTYTTVGGAWQRLLPLVRSDAAKAIVSAMGSEGATIRDLAQRSGTSEAGVRWHLDRMLRAGMVDRRREGNAFLYNLAAAGAEFKRLRG